MGDVSFFNGEGDAKTYTKFAEFLNYYTSARETVVSISQKNLSSSSGIADFCCGTAEITRRIVDKKGGVKKVILIDKTADFIKEAKKLRMRAEVIPVEEDVLDAVIPAGSCDMVISTFAYHHLPDSLKPQFVKQAKGCLKAGGVVVLAEIFIKDASRFYSKKLQHRQGMTCVRERLGAYFQGMALRKRDD